MSEGDAVIVWNGQEWNVPAYPPLTPPLPQPWEVMVKTILDMLGHKEITPERAESWLWVLTEFAEVTYG